MARDLQQQRARLRVPDGGLGEAGAHAGDVGERGPEVLEAAAVAWRTAAWTAAPAMPTLHAAEPSTNHGSVTSSISASPDAGAPRRRSLPTRTSRSWSGAEAFPRSPRPVEVAGDRQALGVRGHQVDLRDERVVGARRARRDDERVDVPRAVAQLLSAVSTTSSPSARARETCAQKWPRDPRSEYASEVRWSPRAIARSVSAAARRRRPPPPAPATRVWVATTCMT
jgi:hypothetical protein